jgi:hypothetical protein
MFFSRKIFQDLFLCFCLAGLISCNKDVNLLKSELNEYAVPADEATPAERQEIDDTLASISQKAAQYGYFNDFKSIPVLVTSEDSTVTGREGMCQWDKNYRGIFIKINRRVFDRDRSLGRFRAVFSVLLHEIGHCYLGRQHETTLLTEKSSHLQVEVTDKMGGTDFVEDGFPVSVMTVLHSKNCTENCEASSRLPSIPELQDYYVAEVIGFSRINSLRELAQFKCLRWIHDD